MSGIDLSAAVVDAGADALMWVLFPNAMPWDGMTSWESTRDDTKDVLREKVRPILAAAAPLIAEEIAKAIEAEMPYRDSAYRDGLVDATIIAREVTR